MEYLFPLTLYLIEFDCMARRIVFVFTPPNFAASDTESHKGFFTLFFSDFSLAEYMLEIFLFEFSNNI